MLVKELLEKLDNSNSEIDWIEIVCNGESEVFSVTPNKEYLDKEVKKFSLKTQNENDFHTNGFVYMSYPEKFLVIEV